MKGSKLTIPIAAATTFVAVYAVTPPAQGSSAAAPASAPPAEPAPAVRHIYYPNCAAARAAGVAPMFEGDPGYRSELDGDADGIACEPYRRY